MKSLGLVLFLLGVFLAKVSWGAQYTIDKDHSTVTFSVRHLMISNVKGSFDDFDGTFEYEKGESKSWKAEATIKSASINTNNKKRDEHLRKPDFFDVVKFPTLSFKANRVTEASHTEAKLHGDLTMHGVTKPVTLTLTIGGVGVDPWGNKKAAFSATTKIKRSDFGMTYNKALETGGVVIGDEVTVNLEIEGNEVAPKIERKAKK